MSKLKEILESGRAPGLITGNHVDKTTVFYKAPKAIRELEHTPRYKGGPNHSAKDIAKSFGMSVDFIKQTWAKPVKTAIALVLGLFLCLSSNAGQIQPGETLVDGQTVHASDLNNMVGNAILLPAAISSQPLQTFGSSDYLLLYSPVNGELYKQLALSVMQSPFSIALLPAGSPIFTNADLFPFYSASGTNTEAVTWSNLVANVASNLNPSYVRFAVTNPASGTNINYLLPWSGRFSGFDSNNQPFSLWWGPNGVPTYQALSNIESSVASDLGTNLELPFVFTQMFKPWTVYGTNAAFTNAWGYTNVFAITNLTMPGTNLNALVDTDSVPVFSTLQQSNTTFTLSALYQYLTNKNTLPPYTLARIQFSGTPASFTATNFSTTTGIATNIPSAANWTSPTAVSFIGALPPTSPQVVSNTLYYALLTNTTPIGFQIYTNLATANLRTNQILGASVPSIVGTMYWVTNYTSYNADVIQLANNTSVRTAEYDVYFQTNAASSLYYVTPSCQWPSGSSQVGAYLSEDGIFTTTHFRIVTGASVIGNANAPRVEILVNPQ